MPFTPAHAAAVLPLLRTPLPASALVIGSVAPDLPYYTPAGTGWETHTALAVVTTDLAIGAVAWTVWHAVLAPAAVAAAPTAVRARLAGRVLPGVRCRLSTPAAVVWVVAALVVGAATHVGWDAFSHPGRWGTEHLAVLREPIGPLAGYRWVQYLSGILGLVALGFWLLIWWRRTPVRPVPTASPAVVRVWPGLLLVAAIAGTVAALLAPDLRAAAFAGATTGGGAALVASVMAALVWRLRSPGRVRVRTGGRPGRPAAPGSTTWRPGATAPAARRGPRGRCRPRR